MRTVFEHVLQASLYGSIVIAAVLLLRLILRKTPKKYVCLLWLLAFLRLLMPFEIQSAFSLQPDALRISSAAEENITPTVSAVMTPAVPEDAVLPEDGEVTYGDAFSATRPESVSEQYDRLYPGPVSAEVHLVIDWLEIASWVWFAIACGIGLYSAISYFLLKRRVRESLWVCGAWECPGLETAFILGFFRPRIYVPQGIPSQDRDLILQHEHAHLFRGDHWFKLLGFLTLAIHWFNPLVWIAYALLCRDIELACDERVVQDMNLEARKRYSAALLSCSTNRAHLSACPVAFGEISVGQRIQSVLHYRKPSFWISLVGILAIVFVLVFLMTSPAELEPGLQWAGSLREKDIASIEICYAQDTTAAGTQSPNPEWEPIPEEQQKTIIKLLNRIDAQYSYEQREFDPSVSLRVTMKDGTQHLISKCGSIFLMVDGALYIVYSDWLSQWPPAGPSFSGQQDLSILNYEYAISLAAEQDSVGAVYYGEGTISPCYVDGSALAKYLDNANWTRRWSDPWDTSSPGSVEFTIAEGYRIGIFDRNFARVTYDGEVRYYRISSGDYEAALALLPGSPAETTESPEST